MTILTLILALLKLAPMVLEMIRDGRIRDATTEEVMGAFQDEFNKRWDKRVNDAVAASGMPNATTGDIDPFDRANKGASTSPSDGK